MAKIIIDMEKAKNHKGVIFSMHEILGKGITFTYEGEGSLDYKVKENIYSWPKECCKVVGPKFLSYSNLTCYEDDLRSGGHEHYLRYLAAERPPRPPQTLPMAVGSAFDAFVKADMAEKIFGSIEAAGLGSSFDELFEGQVEEQCREAALEAGRDCFDAYVNAGSLASLMLDIKDSEAIRFESTVKGTILCEHNGTDLLVPLLGKPDLCFVKQGFTVILDWKVNGYCSTRQVSPNKGYLSVRLGRGGPFRGIGSHHKDAVPMRHESGLMLNVASGMESLNPTWAGQTASYAWLLASDQSADCTPFISVIHQLACGPKGIRVAELAGLVSCDYQLSLRQRYAKCWQHCLAKLDSPDESLERLATSMYSSANGTTEDKMFYEMTR